MLKWKISHKNLVVSTSYLNLLGICLCVNNVSFTYFKLRIHPISSDANQIKNQDWKIIINPKCLYFRFCSHRLILCELKCANIPEYHHILFFSILLVCTILLEFLHHLYQYRHFISQPRYMLWVCLFLRLISIYSLRAYEKNILSWPNPFI